MCSEVWERRAVLSSPLTHLLPRRCRRLLVVLRRGGEQLKYVRTPRGERIDKRHPIPWLLDKQAVRTRVAKHAVGRTPCTRGDGDAGEEGKGARGGEGAGG